MAESLFVEERRRAIIEHLRRFGRVSVRELSEQMRVSAVTIRQDLRALAENGLLERTYGGAVQRLPQSVMSELSFRVRQSHKPGHKEAIAAAAVALVEEGSSIALDSSTTAYSLVPYLKALENLSVVTNNLMIAQALVDAPQIEVLLPGGRLRRESVSLVGRHDDLPDINLSYGFFGARGITISPGITEVDPEESKMKRALIERCTAPVIIADGEKWGQVAPYTFAELHEIERIITSSDAPEGLVAEFRAAGVIVEMVTVNGAA